MDETFLQSFGGSRFHKVRGCHDLGGANFSRVTLIEGLKSQTRPVNKTSYESWTAGGKGFLLTT